MELYIDSTEWKENWHTRIINIGIYVQSIVSIRSIVDVLLWQKYTVRYWNDNWNTQGERGKYGLNWIEFFKFNQIP